MADEYKLDVLEAIFGTKIIDTAFLKEQMKTNSIDLLSELELYRIFDEDETRVIGAIEDIYDKLSDKLIDKMSEYYFNMPIDMAIATKEQSVIKSLFLNAAERLGFDAGLQEKIDSKLEEKADKLNKRFTFDEASLIHLIEASKGSNIQLEEDIQRRSKRNKRQILRQKEDGTYYLFDVTSTNGIDTYTTGNNIPTTTITRADGTTMRKTTVDSGSNIELSSYPGGKDLIGTSSTDDIMRQVMENLFENLELCVDTYKFFYTKNPDDPIEKSVPIQNTAVFANNSTFDFYYEIDKSNLPHLLGIPRGEMLSEATKKFFAKNGSPINENSSALTILEALLKNKNQIIENRGLIEETGKTYQLFPWEKIILKTSSFMRGDFFKTCFCLVQLDHGINASKEKFASISSTKYDDDIVSDKFDAREVLRDLINTARQKKDFIFRTFVENYDRSGHFLGYVPQSIDTGKSESIFINNRERIRTLNRFRNALRGNSGNGGLVVKSIQNNIMGKRIFSPAEQALAHISISSGLNIGLQISEEAYAFEEGLRKELEGELDKYLQKILAPSSLKRK